MSNKGKFLHEIKKVGAVVKKSASEVGSAIGEAATNISAHAKVAAKVAVLKAEMDAIYLDLGKSVFEDGLMPSNETALNLMNVLFEKSAELEALQAMIADDTADKSVSDVEPIPETVEDEVPCMCEEDEPVAEVADEPVVEVNISKESDPVVDAEEK